MLRRATRQVERLARRLGRAQVEEAATLARALTALAGRDLSAEALPGGPTIATRALLTDRLMRARDPVPWPSAVMRQLDPDDAAFLPPLGLHPVLAGRDRTLLGLPGGGERAAWVDPLGWCGIGVGPSVCAWFGLDESAWPMGRHPDEHGAVATFELRQEWSDEQVGVRTTCTRGPLTLTLMHFPVRLQGEVACALYAKLTLSGDVPRKARLALAMRPATEDGAAPVFHLTRDGDGLWAADGVPLLALGRAGDGLITGRWGQPDPWHRFSGRAGAPGLTHLGRVDVRCAVGQASAAEVWTPTLSPGQEWSQLAVISPPLGSPAALVRTSGPSLWSGASADRRGLLRAGCELRLSAHQVVLDSARLRLLQDPPTLGIAAFLGAVALARLGFVRRAEDRVAGWLERVRRDGRLPGGTGEDAAVLAWAAAEVSRWTGNRAWVSEHLPAWRRLLEGLAGDGASEPGGQGILGQGGSTRWTEIWRAAGLLSSAAALREQDADHTRWALAGGRRREALPALLGAGPWSVADGRAVDGASAALMAAAWLGCVPANHPGALATAAAIRAHHWHGGGVLLQGGAHVAATALLLAVEGYNDPSRDAVGTVAALASSTGALPTARHPARGALGDGDDLLSAALFALLVLDRVQVGRGRLRVLPGIAFARDLPTPLGRIDLDPDPDGGVRVTGRWRGLAPTVERLPPG